MTTMTQPVPPVASPVDTGPRFANAAQWHAALGAVPLDRIVFDPRPGTATERDLLRLVEVEGRLCELVDGTLVEKPVGTVESRIATRLGKAMLNFVEPRGLGDVLGPDATLRMADGDIRLPDVTFISVADLPGGRPSDEAVPTVRPTLAVEVLSAGNTTGEMRRKTREYFDSGSKLVWRIDPRARTVAVFDAATDEPAQVLGEADTLDGGTVLPGFTVALAYLFNGPQAPASHSD